MYRVGNEQQAKEKEQSSSGSGGGSGSKGSPSLNMMRIDPQTLSPIVSSPSSPILSPPPYSPTARPPSYQTSPFGCRNSSNSPISPRRSPVNMLSTNPFIPSHTPNTNPRLIPHFPPPSAFHGGLPLSLNKLYQRSAYLAQAGFPPPTSQPGGPLQRLPPGLGPPLGSPSGPGPKGSSASSLETAVAMHLAKGLNAFDLTRAELGLKSSPEPKPKPPAAAADLELAAAATTKDLERKAKVNGAVSSEKPKEQQPLGPGRGEPAGAAKPEPKPSPQKQEPAPADSGKTASPGKKPAAAPEPQKAKAEA